MKINPGKSNRLIYRNKAEQVWAEVAVYALSWTAT